MATSSSVMISPPPKDTPFFDKRTGRISDIWVGWLNSLTAAGTVLQNLVLMQSVNDDNSAAGDVGDILDSALDVVSLVSATPTPPFRDDAFDAPGYSEPMRALLPVVVELAMRMAAEMPASNGWMQKCAELEALIAAGDPAPFGALGSAAFASSGSFDALGAASAAIAALLAASNTWNGALQTINSNITLWGQLVLKAAGMDWSAATVYGDGLFTGDMHFPYSNGFWYASPNATGWFEFRVITSQGGALAADFLGWQYNTRSTVGGTDVWLTAFQINALTGELTFYTSVALPSGTTLGGVAFGSAATQPSTAFDPAGAAAAAVAGAAFLANTQTFTGTNTFTSHLALAMSGAPRQQLSVGASLDLYSSTTALSPTVNSIRGGAGALLLNSYSTGAVYLAYEGGTGGVIFGNGASAAVASVSAAGVVTATGYKAGSAVGVSGTITIPKLTTANGSITVTDGIITGFVNPT
jgi:hypothetical protein